MLSKEDRAGLRTWIEIDSQAIENNYKVFRSLISSETKLMSIVKSNAYGHGLVDFSRLVSNLGVDWLGVDSIVEALRLRQEGIKKPILVLGYSLPERVEEAVLNDISITLSSMTGLESMVALALDKPIKAHIKIDSGMHRQGFMEPEMPSVIEYLKKHSDRISVEGMYTHFAAAKNPAEPELTHEQLAVFKKWVAAFKDAGFSPIIHAAATGATLLFPETHFDMVRVGIGFHGIWPSKEAKEFAEKKVMMKPTLTWKTLVSEAKKLNKGEKIGYDFTETLTRDSVVAICPIGYWHGFPRALSSIGHVLIRGAKAKVLGRVAMDMIVVDITDVAGIDVGDEVVVIGRSGSKIQSADMIADLLSMSVYEFITRIDPLIKKFYISSSSLLILGGDRGVVVAFS